MVENQCTYTLRSSSKLRMKVIFLPLQKSVLFMAENPAQPMVKAWLVYVMIQCISSWRHRSILITFLAILQADSFLGSLPNHLVGQVMATNIWQRSPFACRLPTTRKIDCHFTNHKATIPRSMNYIVAMLKLEADFTFLMSGSLAAKLT